MRLDHALERWRRVAGRSANDLLELCLPQICPACGGRARADRVLCEPCVTAIPPAGLLLCARCLRAEREPVGCSIHPGFGVHVAWLYDERAAAVIAAFKYDGRPRLAEFMGAALASSVHLGAVDFVTAVPMHPTRRRERGFDHTAELARVCARMTGLPMLDGVLERTRFAAPQARLRPAARRKAVRDTVAVRNREAVRGRRIVVVDDVITTGATLEACLAVLEAEGARACGLALAWAQ